MHPTIRHQPRHGRSEPGHRAATAAATPQRRRRLLGVAIVGALISASTPAFAHESHTVSEGDSLWDIAIAHGLTVAELATANALDDPDLIVVGSTLRIPGATGNVTTDSAGTYTVREGDTVWDIAAAHGIGVGMLARQNGLTGVDPVIRPGQVLVITPGAPVAEAASSGVSAATHTVAVGDTFWAVAGRYGVDIDLLISHNGLAADSVLRPGDVLAIPGDPSTLPRDLRNSPAKMALMPVFDRWASEYDVPPDLLKALTWFESGWDNTQVSSANALGIGQILPITARFVSENLLGEELDPSDPEDNIRLAARYLRYLLDNTDDVGLAVASYYQGLTATRRHGVYRSSVFYVEGILALRSQF